MQSRDNDHQPLGICHRLFNFIMSSLVPRGFKRLTMGRPMSNDSAEVPLVGSPRIREAHKKPKDYSSSEIAVEFRNINGEENWTSVDNLGSSVHVPNKDGLIMSGDHTLIKKGVEKKNKEKESDRVIRRIGIEPSQKKEIPLVQEIKTDFSQVQGKSPLELEASTAARGQGGGPKKTVIGKDSAGELEKEKNKKIANEKWKLEIKPEVDKSTPPTDLIPFLTSVASNINEKSDEFLRSRKERMSRNYSLESRQS